MKQEWLSNLEEKVQAAASRLRDLRQEKEEVDARCRELESRIEDLEAQLADSAQEGAAEWHQERDDIRQRVEKLADHLTELLAE